MLPYEIVPGTLHAAKFQFRIWKHFWAEVQNNVHLTILLKIWDLLSTVLCAFNINIVIAFVNDNLKWSPCLLLYPFRGSSWRCLLELLVDGGSLQFQKLLAASCFKANYQFLVDAVCELNLIVTFIYLDLKTHKYRNSYFLL